MAIQVRVTMNWRGNVWSGRFQAAYRRNLADACRYLVRIIRFDISQKGTLTYRRGLGRGHERHYETVRVLNFTHSLPGHPPFRQTGDLWRSIDWSVIGNTGMIGSDVDYSLFLETGTPRMKPRPFLRVNMARYRNQVRAILVRKVSGAAFPNMGPTTLARPGYLGAGARRLGYH